MMLSSIVAEGQLHYQIERDFHAEVCQITETRPALTICEYIWKSTPLLGEYILDHKMQNEVLSFAKSIFRQIIQMPTISLSISNERMVALAMILLTQEQDNTENESKLWDYLFAQLGYDDIAARRCSWQTLYKKVTDLLDHAFLFGGRFYSTTGHRYFNTLRLHALAPAQSVEHLYNLLYDFYKTNLEYQYIEGDNSYRIFVMQICKRWKNTPVHTESEWKSRSDYLAASFRELFTQKPEYTAALCDALVYRMDAMLRGNNGVFTEENRWDRLMLDWYHKKAETERKRMKQSSAQARISRVVTDSSQIAPVYYYKDEKISLLLPRIRLPEITECPIVILLQNERVIDSKVLSVFGNDLCLTTRELEISLSDLDKIEWDSPMQFRILLRCGDKLIYDSGDQLFRPYLLFRSDGAETKHISQTAKIMYLVYGYNSEMAIDDTEDNYYIYGSDYQVLEFIPASLRLLVVDGKSLLQSDKQSLHCAISGNKVPGANVTHGEQTAWLFSSIPKLFISADSEELIKQYVYVIDGIASQLYQATNGQTTTQISLPAEPNQLHRICIRGFFDGQVIFEQAYCFIPGFSYCFEPAYYHSKQLQGKVLVSASDLQNTISFELNCDNSTLSFPLTFETMLELSIPWVHADLNGDDALSMPAHVWRDYFHSHSFMQITAPKWLEIHLMLGGTEISQQQNRYDIRSAVRALYSSAHSAAKYPLGLLLRKDGAEKPDQILLSNIAVQPFFTESPVICHDRTIFWEPIGKYVGPDDGIIRVFLQNDEGKEPWIYVCDTKKAFVIEPSFPCSEGNYRYEIRLEQTNPFGSSEQSLYQGVIKIRDPEELRFEGQIIQLNAAKFETNSWLSSWEAKIPFGCARLVDIQYETISVPLDGKLKGYQNAVPCFSAYLQFFMAKSNRWIDFNYDPEQTEYTLINPVVFWQVTSSNGSDYLIIQGKDGKRIMMEEFRSGSVRVVNRTNLPPSNCRRKRADRFRFQVETDYD